MTKKLIAILLVALLALTFVACKGEPTTEDNPTETPTETATPTPEETPTEAPTETPTQAPDTSLQAGEVTIPKLTVAPTLDGDVTDDEWANAYQGVVSAADVKAGKGFSFNGKTDEATACNFYLYWADDGIYAAYKVTDATKSPSKTKGMPLNEVDTVQLLLDPLNEKINAEQTGLYIFDWVSASKPDRTGPSIWYEHWRYNAMDENLGVKVAGKDTDEGYTIEAFVPWSALTKKGEQFTPATGYKIGFGHLLVDFDVDGKMVDLYSDYGSDKNDLGIEAKLWTGILG